ncbi:MAG: Eco29kI family restriction endonuclease [Phycisphaeraceae bacterium]|nr:Eco29kI family restriction endonuclease [Phycisphaeraceae bacterium]MBX3365712.1 Eco29kI family restriction endonuclease [Phycisphaeraceae bacterium]QYK48208.1 MAG: Eco29kI family restriction endonuclease [Phycisphaeraceae bacterium]
MDDHDSTPHRFEFDLDLGIRDQVVRHLEESPSLQLHSGVGPTESGVYALYHKGELVYIGKASKGTTKSKRTLRARLNEHVAKIKSRQNIAIEDVACKYLVFESEWWVFAAEFALISHHNPKWNATGFGSKTPGKGRPGTDIVSEWDRQYPKR